MTSRYFHRFAIPAMALAFAATGGWASAAEPSFRPLDFSPTAVSADGAVVVGTRNSGGGTETTQAVRWTAAGGLVSLGTLPDHAGSRAYGVSADGSVVVGSIVHNRFRTPEAFRWTAETGMVGLGHPGNYIFGGKGNATSADGSVVVGSGGWLSATRWTAAGGMAVLPSFDPVAGGEATDVSADGSVVVGATHPYSWGPVGGIGAGPSVPARAFRWTATSGSIPLFDTRYDFRNDTRFEFRSPSAAVSADGSVIVGSNDTHAVRWSADGGVMSLGTLAGRNRSYAYDVSADGSVVAGSSYSHGAGPDYPLRDFEAFVWDESNGMRSLSKLLGDLGVNMSGWALRDASGVSADGLTFVGTGTDPSGRDVGWIATIPEPGFVTPAAVALAGLLARPRRDPTGMARHPSRKGKFP